LALALPVVMPVADVYYFFCHPRDQLANNNKGGEKKRNNYATLGDMQHNSAI
jgi:hypothetical protein